MRSTVARPRKRPAPANSFGHVPENEHLLAESDSISSAPAFVAQQIPHAHPPDVEKSSSSIGGLHKAYTTPPSSTSQAFPTTQAHHANTDQYMENIRDMNYFIDPVLLQNSGQPTGAFAQDDAPNYKFAGPFTPTTQVIGAARTQGITGSQRHMCPDFIGSISSPDSNNSLTIDLTAISSGSEAGGSCRDGDDDDDDEMSLVSSSSESSDDSTSGEYGFGDLVSNSIHPEGAVGSGFDALLSSSRADGFDDDDASDSSSLSGTVEMWSPHPLIHPHARPRPRSGHRQPSEPQMVERENATPRRSIGTRLQAASVRSPRKYLFGTPQRATDANQPRTGSHSNSGRRRLMRRPDIRWARKLPDFLDAQSSHNTPSCPPASDQPQLGSPIAMPRFPGHQVPAANATTDHHEAISSQFVTSAPIPNSSVSANEGFQKNHRRLDFYIPIQTVAARRAQEARDQAARDQAARDQEAQEK